MHNAPERSAIPDLLLQVTMDSATERRLTIALATVLLPIVIAAFIINAAVEARPAAVVSATLSDSADGHLVEIRDAQGAVVLSGEFRSRVDSIGNTEKDAELTAQTGESVIGEIELEIPAASRQHRRPELEVDVIHLRPRHRYSVVIDDRTVGTFVTDDRGNADMELQEGEILTRS
jgi:hypothetical protein